MFGFASTLNAAHKKAKSHRELRGRDGRFHGRTNRAGLTTAGTAKDRLLYFGGQKIGELGFGVALGAMQAYGDPLFFSSDPAKAMGPKLLGSILLNGIEFMQLLKGWSLARFLGPTGGAIGDGVIAGGASACWSIYAFDNSNTYFAAKIEQSKGGTGTAGLDYGERERRQLYAPSHVRQEVSPAAVAGEPAALRAADNARKADFERRTAEAQGLVQKARSMPIFRQSSFD